MLHRAMLGSLERFYAIYVEHVAGKFPVWIAPEQAILVTVSEKQAEYADRVQQELVSKGLRVIVDSGPDKLGAKIRNARMMRHPYIVVIGEDEVTAGTADPALARRRRARQHAGRRVRGTPPRGGQTPAAVARLRDSRFRLREKEAR